MKIPFDSLTLMAVTQEIVRALVRGRIQRVTQPEPLELVLTVRNASANHHLVLSADPMFARAHLTVVKRPNPPEPPAFCMICRKHLEGGTITSIHQLNLDRILRIGVETAGLRVTLVAELMGNRSNVILVSESGMVLDAMKRVSHKQNRFREVLPGVPYVSPPAQSEKASPFEVSDSDLNDLSDIGDSETLKTRIMDRFQGMSPFLATELAAREAKRSLIEAWNEIFMSAKAGAWNPTLIRGDDNRPNGAYPFPTVQAPADRQNERAGMNIALDHYYGAALPGAELDTARNSLSTEIDRALKAREKKRESLRRSLEESGRADEYRQTGDLLLANLHRIDDSAESVTVDDYYAEGAPERVITLDSSKSSKDNVEAYFRRYRKAKDSAEIHQRFLDVAEEDMTRLRAAAESIRDVTAVDQIKTVRTALTIAGTLRDDATTPSQERKRNEFQGKKIRVVHTPEGWEVLVGENSEANDYLTSRVASPNDLWLHVRSSPSAHVVIRTRNDPTRVPHSVIERAAILAAKHSAAKHSGTVPVDYTLKKYVRRPRGGAPGAALYQNEKTIHVSPKE